jgi:hypothetical protein
MTLQPQASVQLTYADRPEIPETFADLLRHAISEGVNVKLEFVVNRFEPAVAAAPIVGRSVTACRLVMPLSGLMDMMAKLGSLVASLQAQGVIAQLPPKASVN